MRLALRHRVQLQPDAKPALVAHLDRRTGQPRRPHVLNRDHSARGHQLQTGLQQPLFGERIADLHGWPLFLDRIVKFGAGHGRPANPVAPRFRAQIHHRHPHARGHRVKDLVAVSQPRRKGVDQTIAVVTAMKAHFAPDGRHAKRVAITADALDHALDQMRGLGVRHVAETQRVHRRNRPRPHGEHVAQDAADARRRALIRLDVTGVIVALHLEDHRLPVADIDNPGILARPADHLASGRGQSAQPFLRRFVRAMLIPHRRKDPQFGIGRDPPDDLQQSLILVRLQPVSGDQDRGDLGLGHAASSRRDGRVIVEDSQSLKAQTAVPPNL